MFLRSSKIGSIATVAGLVVAGWLAGATIANEHNLSVISARAATNSKIVSAARQGVVISGIAQIQSQSILADAEAAKSSEALAALDKQLDEIDTQLKDTTAKRDVLEQQRRVVALDAGITEIQLRTATANHRALAVLAGQKAESAAPYLRSISLGNGN